MARISLRAAAALIAALSAVPTAGAQANRVVVRMRPYATPVVLDTLAIPFDFPVSHGQTWSAVRAAFTALRIPITTSDSSVGVMGNLRFTASTIFAGHRMSHWVDCGSTAALGNNADRFRLTMAIAALVDARGNAAATARIGLAASGLSVDGSSMDPVACASTGLLEARLAEEARKALTGP